MLISVSECCFFPECFLFNGNDVRIVVVFSKVIFVRLIVSPGESPSSSASDVDSFNHQGVIDKFAKTKRGLSHVARNLLPVALSQPNIKPLLDFVSYPIFIIFFA